MIMIYSVPLIIYFRKG